MDVTNEQRSGGEGQLSSPRQVSDATNFALILAMVGPPLLWLTQFEIIYANVQPACDANSLLLPILSVVLCFALVVIIGLIAAKELWSAQGDEPLSKRVRFMAGVGIMVCSMFALVTLAQGIAMIFISPCQS